MEAADRDQWRRDPEAQAALKQSIHAVLERLFVRGEEVPLVAMYRKEQCGELLSLRSSDEPGFTGDDGMEGTQRYPQGTVQVCG